MEDTAFTKMGYKYEGLGFYTNLNFLCHQDQHGTFKQCWKLNSINYVNIIGANVKINKYIATSENSWDANNKFQLLMKILKTENILKTLEKK